MITQDSRIGNVFDAMGTIVTFDAPKEVAFAVLQQAMTDTGIDLKYAKEMLPRNAFSRAAKQLSDERIIRQVEEGDYEIQFQFTREWLDSGEYKYGTECHLWLHKDTGIVRCPDNANLAIEAHRLLLEHQGKRNCSDVTRLVKRIFDDRKGDLVSLRKTGGVYFVPDSHTYLVDQLCKLMSGIGGMLNRYVIRFGDSATTDSIAENMADHMGDIVDQIRDACKNLDSDSSPEVIERRLNMFKEARAKATNYQGLMAGFVDSVADEINRAEAEMVRLLMGRDPTPEELTAAELAKPIATELIGA